MFNFKTFNLVTTNISNISSLELCNKSSWNQVHKVSTKLQDCNKPTLTTTHFSFSAGCCGDVITPVQTEVHGTIGNKITLSCNYSTALSLYWYRQYPRSTPDFLLLILQNSGESENTQLGMSVKLNKKKTSVDLEISSAKVTDSAVYYCALKPTVRGNPAVPYKILNLSEQSKFKNWKI